MPIYTAQTRTNDRIGLKDGFTLVEAMVVLVIAALFVVMAMMNLGGLVKGSSFKAQANEFVNVLNMAAQSAAQSDRRYEIIIDLTEQQYIVRESTSENFMEDVLDEEIIVHNNFTENCRVDYVLFDDFLDTDAEHQIAYFRVSSSGFQNGGKIVLVDEEGGMYTVIINRINRIIELKKGEVDFLLPLEREEIVY